MARRTRLPRGRRSETKPSSPLVIVASIVGVLVAVFGFGFAARWLATQAAPVLLLVADGDHVRVIALLLLIWGSVPPLILGGVRLHSRRGRWVAAPVWVLVVGLALLLFGFLPGRGDDGRLGRELNAVAGGSPLADTGSVYIGSALAAVACLIVVAPTTAWWMRLDSFGERRTTARTVTGIAGYAAAWVGAGAIVLSVVGGSTARISWLEDTADVLRGGDSGVTGDFQVGLDTSVLHVVDCDTAAERLRVGDRQPELDGCRKALLVAATGRYDDAGTRTGSGSLVAVVIQVRTPGQLDDLDAALDDAEIVPGGGLPEPPVDTLVTQAVAALSLVVAAEDTGDIPLPAEGAGRRPLSRALAYVVIGTAVGLYVSPPEETPAETSTP